MKKNLFIGYSLAQVYPYLKVGETIKLAIQCFFIKDVEVIEGYLPDTKLEYISECTYNIKFSDFEIEDFYNNSFNKKVQVFKIPYTDEQYFTAPFLLKKNIKEQLLTLKNSENKYIFSLKVELAAELDNNGVSKLYCRNYLYDSIESEPDPNSLTHYLLKTFFIDWKIKSIKNVDTNEIIEDMDYSGANFILELEYQDFIDTYDNVAYDSIGDNFRD